MFGVDAANTRIWNLAAGEVNEQSKEDVNGSQLYGVTNIIAGNLVGGASVRGDGTLRGPTYSIQQSNYETVYDAFAAVSSNLDAITNNIDKINNGDGIKYFHTNSTAADSHAKGENSVAVGPESVAVGEASFAARNGARAKADGAIAIGDKAVAVGKNDVVMGAGSKSSEVVATTATTIKGKRYEFAGGAPVANFSVGDKDNERTITNLAAGRIGRNSTDAVNASQLYATNQAVESLASDVRSNSEVAVKYDVDSQGKKTNSVPLQGTDQNAPVLLGNVADGVNVGQLKVAYENSQKYTDNQIQKEAINTKNETDAKSIETLSLANEYTDSRLGQMNGEIAGLHGDINDERSEAR